MKLKVLISALAKAEMRTFNFIISPKLDEPYSQNIRLQKSQ